MVESVAVPVTAVDPLNSATWFATGEPLVVTVPVPAGVDHVPSPLQKVDEDADVPELRLVTGRFPVTPPLPDAARFMALTVGLGKLPPSPPPAPVMLVMTVPEDAGKV